MGTLFVHRLCEDHTREIANNLGLVLQTSDFFIDLDVTGRALMTSRLYEQ